MSMRFIQTEITHMTPTKLKEIEERASLAEQRLSNGLHISDSDIAVICKQDIPALLKTVMGDRCKDDLPHHCSNCDRDIPDSLTQ